MAQNFKQLGQLRPGVTSAVELYSPAASTETIVKTVTVCNTTAGAVTFRIFHDDDGTTYDQTTALYYDVNIAANTTTPIEINIMLDDSSSSLAVSTSNANALTFTAYGSEVT